MLMGTSIGLEEELSNLHIYPNPSNGIVNIDVSSSFIVTINDILGKVVSTEEINSNTVFNLEHLDKGVYFVNVSNGLISNTTKVIIE